MHRRASAQLIAAALLLGVLLSACGSAEPTLTPLPSPTASPSPSPKPTPSSTPSPLPAATPLPLDESLLDRRVTVLV
ncbi:MAG TPA: hypothetical protein VEW45_00740, partial [Candidatus Dormibacteraeota bacterium]|nr:hypothetical protein [Candidatus Dormibacteraeota bacterium]